MWIAVIFEQCGDSFFRFKVSFELSKASFGPRGGSLSGIEAVGSDFISIFSWYFYFVSKVGCVSECLAPIVLPFAEHVGLKVSLLPGL